MNQETRHASLGAKDLVVRRLPFYGCTIEAAERLAISLQLLIEEFGGEESRHLQPRTVDIPPPANLHQIYITAFVNIHDTNRNQRVVEICSRQSLQVDGRYVQVQESDRDAAHLRDRYKTYSWTLGDNPRTCGTVNCDLCGPPTQDHKRRKPANPNIKRVLSAQEIAEGKRSRSAEPPRTEETVPIQRNATPASARATRTSTTQQTVALLPDRPRGSTTIRSPVRPPSSTMLTPSNRPPTATTHATSTTSTPPTRTTTPPSAQQGSRPCPSARPTLLPQADATTSQGTDRTNSGIRAGFVVSFPPRDGSTEDICVVFPWPTDGSCVDLTEWQRATNPRR